MKKSLQVLLLCAIGVLVDVYGQGGEYSNANIRIINSSPVDGTIIKRGRSVRLSCRTDAKWFFCLWRSPLDDKSCAIQQNREPQSVCDADPRLQLDTGQTNCDLIIREVEPEDFGRWLCLVNEPNEFTSDRATVAIEVGQQAKVSLEAKGMDDAGQLIMTEGETVKIKCSAIGGHPVSQLSWEEPRDAKLDTKTMPVIRRDSSGKTSDVTHVAEYKANLRDNGTEITCVATQIDYDGRTILYESSTSVKLRIQKLILPVDNALTQKIGIISGVLLAILLLILVIVFCIMACCRRRQRRRKRRNAARDSGTLDGRPGRHGRIISSSSSRQLSDDDTTPSPEQPIKPIWTPAPSAPHGHDKTVVSTYSDLLDTGVVREQHRQPAMNGTRLLGQAHSSQATVSSRSTTSSCWDEEDRSVGGEVEEAPPVSIERPRPTPVSTQHQPVQETHFDFDMSHPSYDDPFLMQPHYMSYNPVHHPLLYNRYGQMHLGTPVPARPSSSSDCQPGGSSSSFLQRPTSATGFRDGLTLMSTPRPGSQMTTSVKSVFDCDLGCFVDLDATPDKSKEEDHEEDVKRRNSVERTSDPRDV